MGLSLIPVLFFVYINCVMLVILKSKAAFQGMSRYILFGHMLFADTFQLIWSLLCYIVAMVKIYMSNGLCVIILLVANILTRISPLNLAVMALERCLSPLIYGLRDESFRPVFVHYFTFSLKNKIKPTVA
ncbi:hypothetical protein AAFF_G00079230 [Aldrovandia affinis]|uniref:Uncharacterized protein n=1 Tax=Aldrovandia affinis TaxID=143900 RepID=A0AAD7RXG3_9TELE|nr:hypothetical protein AAFF_G00079230 [Aldrovandia affinis]